MARTKGAKPGATRDNPGDKKSGQGATKAKGDHRDKTKDHEGQLWD